jgi:hypothetical protein
MRNQVTCKIRVSGHLGPGWSAWFEGMAVRTLPTGDTELVGELIDDAALFGVLLKIRDLGLHLVSMRRVQPRLARR